MAPKVSFIDRIEEILISIFLGGATLLVFAQVVARYVFNSGISWAPELVEHTFLWIVMIGASYGFKHGVHLGVDLMVKRLRPTVRKKVVLLSVFISLLFTGGMTYLSVFYVYDAYVFEKITVDMEIPQWIPFLALPLGFLLISIRLVQVGWLVWTDQQDRIAKGSAPLVAEV